MVSAQEWNSRPIEDRLRRELVGLAKVMQAMTAVLSCGRQLPEGAALVHNKKATAIIDEHGSKGDKK
jgi:hypothetical protein